MEHLEDRTLLAGLYPTILEVLPKDGERTPNAKPDITVRYSENMVSGGGATAADNPANYRLFDSTGNRITIDSITWDKTTNTATLLYNSGNILPIDAFTLFVRGDQVYDLDTPSARPLSGPGQLVVANSAIGNVTVVNSNYQSGQLGALSNVPPAVPGLGTGETASLTLTALQNLSGSTAPNIYTVTPTGASFTLTFAGELTNPIPAVTATSADVQTALEALSTIGKNHVSVLGKVGGPYTVTLDPDFTDTLSGTGARVDQKPILDLVVVNDAPDDPIAQTQGTSSILIFQGRQGGGFDPLPTVTLNVPRSTSSPVGNAGVTGITFGDVDKDGALDMAISSQYRDTATVYLNGNQKGRISFSSNDYAVDKGGQPGGVALADMDLDGNLDLLISNRNTMARGTATKQVNEYNITVWKGLGDGSFQSKAVRNGDAVRPTFIEIEIGSPDAGTTGLNPWGVLMDRTTSGAMVAADVNGSGTPDIIIAGTNGIGVLINASAGVIQFSYSQYPPQPWPQYSPDPFIVSPPAAMLYPANQGPGTRISAFAIDGNSELLGGSTYVDVVVGNFNGKGGLDLAGLTNKGGVDIYLNGTGPFSCPYSFLPSKSLAVGTVTGKLAVADLNGDGFDDLLATNNNVTPPAQTTGSGLQVLLNKGLGDGDFTVSTPAAPTGQYDVAGQPLGVAVGDTNQDGVMDVVTGGQQLQSATTSGLYLQAASLLLGERTGDGTPTGKFVVPVVASLGASVSPGSTPGPTASADVNNDGLPDLVQILTTNTPGKADQVAVFLAKTDTPGDYSNISVPYDVGVGKGPIAVAIADMDNDGNPDIVVADKTTSDFTILYNNKTPGTFGPAVTYDAKLGLQPTGLAVADFDGDGLRDVAISHNSPLSTAGNQGVSVSLNLGLRTFETASEVAPGTYATDLVATDFNHDLIQDILVTDNNSGTVNVLYGNGFGAFPFSLNFRTVDNPGDITLGDFNRDGFQDVVVMNRSASSSLGQLAVMLSSFGTGLNRAIATDIVTGVTFKSIAVTNINGDAFPDVVLSVAGEVDAQGSARYSADNVYTLLGNGDGSFKTTSFYQVGGPDGKPPPSNDPGVPNHVSVINDPFMKLTTFETGGKISNNNLLRNASFEKADLTGEKSNLIGWATYRVQDTHGRWGATTGPLSPISLDSVTPPPRGQYAAMVDQAILTVPWDAPIGVGDYSGTNLLYQDVFIPENATSLTFSMFLSLQSSARWTDPSLSASLDYRTPKDTQVRKDNQQVRIDLVVPPAALPGDPLYQSQILDVKPFNPSILNPLDPSYGSVLKNLYQTTADDPLNTPYLPVTKDLTGELGRLAGKTVRLRIAAVTNIDHLIVGVDDVQFRAIYNDSTQIGPTLEAPALAPAPGVSKLRLRNAGVGVTTTVAGNTTDPTIVGFITDDALASLVGSPNNLYSLAFDTNGNGNFNDLGDVRINEDQWDPLGNFALTLDPNALSPGENTVNIQLRDKVDNIFNTSLTFNYLGSGSKTIWSALGPAAISTAGLNVSYPEMSGRVTEVAVDPSDPAGNTYLVGSENGGVWKTTNGGQSWTPLTDHVNDRSGNPINVSVGGMAVDPLNPKIIYVATGIGDNHPDSRPGVGVLKSTDGGLRWAIAGNSDSVLKGARVTKLAIGADGPNFIYVAVASGGASGPGVYRSTDGGDTWANILAIGPNLLDDQDAPITGLSANFNALSTPADASLTTIPTNLLRLGTQTSGTFTLSFKGQTTTPIAFNATAADIQAALLALSSVGAGNATVTGQVGGPFTIGFVPALTLALPSVTDLLIDPFDSKHITIGLGNMLDPRLTPTGETWPQPSIVTGVFVTGNSGNQWKLVIGGKDPLIAPDAGTGLPSNTLPTGLFVLDAQGQRTQPGPNLGRITLAQGHGRVNDERNLYVLIANPPDPTAIQPNATLLNGQYYTGNFQSSTAPAFDETLDLPAGLYKSKDYGLNWTRVRLRTNISPTSEDYQDINLLGGEAGDTGAMMVDPNNPAIVFVGGSRRYANNINANPASGTQLWPGPVVGFDSRLVYSFIRVDTTLMRDTTYTRDSLPGSVVHDTRFNVFGATGGGGMSTPFLVPNDGDDIVKYDIAFDNQFDPGVGCFCFDDGVEYFPVGVSWVDLEANNVFRDGAPGARDRSYLPTGINALAFDAQGRLLVGTERGIWRGVDHGFPHADQTGKDPALSGQPMSLTSLNFNLQISSLTSVGVDPNLQNNLYTSETGTGTARTPDGLFGWRTMGVTGPIDPVTSDRFNPDPRANSLRTSDPDRDLKVPDSAAVRVGSPTPGTPTQVYRSWAFQSPRGLVTEFSIFAGDMGTFDQSPAIGQGNILNNATLNAPQLPPMAISRVPAFNNNQYYDQLIFGTDRVFRTNTGARAWTDIVGRPLSNNPLSGAATGLSPDFTALSTPTNASLTYASTYQLQLGTQTSGTFTLTFRGQTTPALAFDATAAAIQAALQALSSVGAGNATVTGQVGGPFTISFISLVTALAFAGSDSNSIYAGTNRGEVYVTLNNGQDNWPLRSDGLPPNVRINGLTGHPDKPKIAWAMLGGGQDIGGHVWMTTDAGQTWKSISKGLPDVPANALAVDDEHTNRLFVGTDVGVYISTNGGASWSRYGKTFIDGNSLPNAPVVDLQFNSKTETLAAATGRGVFTISSDIKGPRVAVSPDDDKMASVLPSSPRNAPLQQSDTPPLNTITVNFDEAIAPSTMRVSLDEANRSTIVAAPLLRSRAYYTNLVKQFYATYLQRQPTARELNAGVAGKRAGRSNETLISGIVGSDTYFATRASSDLTTWVITIYADLLGRTLTPTSTEVTAALTMYQQKLTNSPSKARTTTAYNIVLTSDEYRAILVTSYYNKYLQRPPTASEISAGVGSFQLKDQKPTNKSRTDETIIASLLGSLEYYRKNGAATYVDANYTAPVSGLPAFDPGAKPVAVALGDMNADGFLDVVSANNGSNTVTIFYGGNTSLPPTVLSLPSLTPYQLVLGTQTAGTFTLTFNGQTTTPALAFNATAATIQAALQALSSVGAGTATVTGPVGGRFTITFAPALSGALSANFTALSTPGNASLATLPPTLARPKALVLESVGGVGLDIIVANSGTNSVAVFLNQGGGTFAPAATYAAGNSPGSLVVADFNGDGIKDIATGDRSPDVLGNYNVNILPGLAGGGFDTANAKSFNAGVGGINGLAQGDLGGGTSALPELVVAGVNGLQILINTSTAGTFVVARRSTYTLVLGTQTAGTFRLTFNGQTTPPLAFNATAAAIQTALQNLSSVGAGNATVTGVVGGPFTISFAPALSAGTLSASFTALSTPANASLTNVPTAPLSPLGTSSVAIGNIDTDTIPDIVASADSAPGRSGGVIQVYQNRGSLNFSPATNGPFVVGNRPLSVTIRDLNGDGRNDVLVVNNQTNGTFTVLLNSTVAQTGVTPDLVTFGNAVSFGTGGNPSSLALADLNGDLILDVVTANSTTDDFWALLGYSDGSFHGPTDADYITNAYLHLLGDDPTAAKLKSTLRTLAAKAQISISGPRGTTSPLDVSALDRRNPTSWQLTFAPQTFDGTYKVIFGRNVTDIVGNPMNRNVNVRTGKFSISTNDSGRFITGMVHDLLNRSADTALFQELQTIVDAALNKQMNIFARKYVKQYLMQSPIALPTGVEARTALINNIYTQFLGRLPLPAELPALLASIARGVESFLVSILTSPEYVQRAGNTNMAWLTHMFSASQLNLALNIDDEHRDLLNTKAFVNARQKAADTILLGTEYLTNLVNGWYDTFLKREPTSGQLKAALVQLRRRVPYRNIIAGLVGGAEYFDRIGVTTNEQWLNQVFTDLLGRGRGPFEGIVEFLNPLNALGPNPYNSLAIAARTRVATSIMTTYQQSLAGTPEFRTNLVNRYYNQILARSATNMELQFWLTPAPSYGPNDRVILYTLLKSNEYYDRSHPFP